MASQPHFKKVFILDFENNNPGDCGNCSGSGYLYIFAVTEGPYQSPTAPYRADGKVSKWFDNKWWVGNTLSFQCPDCKGLGRAGIQEPATHEITIPRLFQ